MKIKTGIAIPIMAAKECSGRTSRGGGEQKTTVCDDVGRPSRELSRPSQTECKPAKSVEWRAGKTKILGWFTITAITAAIAFAGETGIAPEQRVTVCIDPSSDGREIHAAQRLASKVFARIRVGVDWRELRSCPVDGNALRVTLSYNTPEDQLPGALAYALPYEGSHVVLFYDRLRKSDANQVTCSLAYVLVHEVTHILEGISRHSTRGIMKAQWNREDRFEIAIGRLEFAPEDIDLIYRRPNRREFSPILAESPVPEPVAAR